jgi:hypothetical protein
MSTKKKSSRKKVSPKIEKVDLETWMSTIKSGHENALAATAAATPVGCCQVQNQQTGGVFQIATDAATCQSIGGVFVPGPC